MYLVTSEDDDNGVWWEDPEGFDTEDEAKEYIKYAAKLPEGYSYVIYRCYQTGD